LEEVDLPGLESEWHIAYRNGAVIVITNLGPSALPLPSGAVVLASGPLLSDGTGTLLPSDTTAWVVQA
jgi:alpha-glucosidase